MILFYITASALLLITGAIAGFQCCARRYRSNSKTVLDIETFNYLVERDNELWEIEKRERQTPAFSSAFQVSADGLQSSEPTFSLN